MRGIRPLEDYVALDTVAFAPGAAVADGFVEVFLDLVELGGALSVSLRRPL